MTLGRDRAFWFCFFREDQQGYNQSLIIVFKDHISTTREYFKPAFAQCSTSNDFHGSALRILSLSSTPSKPRYCLVALLLLTGTLAYQSRRITHDTVSSPVLTIGRHATPLAASTLCDLGAGVPIPALPLQNFNHSVLSGQVSDVFDRRVGGKVIHCHLFPTSLFPDL